MRRNTHIIIPASHFTLKQGEDNLTLYQFGTRTAKHYFCRTCGITSFYIPRSNPDGVAVTIGCIDEGTMHSVEVKQYDGVNWEDSYAQSHIAAESAQ